MELPTSSSYCDWQPHDRVIVIQCSQGRLGGRRCSFLFLVLICFQCWHNPRAYYSWEVQTTGVVIVMIKTPRNWQIAINYFILANKCVFFFLNPWYSWGNNTNNRMMLYQYIHMVPYAKYVNTILICPVISWNPECPLLFLLLLICYCVIWE